MKYDTIVIGAGIAGASAALQLSRRQHVLLIEAERPAAGASGVAGGLFSPMIALRGRPVWQIDEAIDAFREQLEMADAVHLFDGRGVLRPAKDAQQVEFFEQSVQMCPYHADWLSPKAVRERYPKIRAPLGALFAKTGGAISTSFFSEKMVDAAVHRGVTYIQGKKAAGWGETGDNAYMDVVDAIETTNGPSVRYRADRIVLAVGRTFFEHPALLSLDLHAVKGQTIRIKRPADLAFEDLVPASGLAYIIPEDDTLAIGSTFEHTFKDDAVSAKASRALLKKAAALLPSIGASEIVEENVGIRVTVPKIRLPMVGPMPGHPHIWVFTGFGSKGLLLAPMLARRLVNFFDEPGSIPPEIRVRVKT